MSESASADTRPPAGIREALVLGLVGALAFVGALDNGFVNWDDGLYIERNVLVVEPAAHSLAEHLLTPELGYPLPLPVAIYRLLWSEAGAAWPFHLVGLLIHGCNVALLALSLRHQLPRAVWAVRLGVMAFAAHPLVVEPVVWATGLKDLLACTAALLAFFAFVRGRVSWIILATLLGVASKPVAGLVGVALLVAWWRRPEAQASNKAMGPVLGALALAGLAWLAFTVIQEPPELRTSLQEWPTPTRVLGALGLHVSHVLVPAGLSPWYPVSSVSVVDMLLGALVMGGAAWLGWTWAKHRDPRWAYLVLGAAVYLPASNLKPLIRFTADSYVYVTWACAMAIAAHAWARHGEAMLAKAERAALFLKWGPTIIVLAWLPLTAMQVETWRDTLSLWGNAWTQYPHDGTLVVRYGDALGRAGRAEEELALYVENLEALEEATKVPPALVLWFEHEDRLDECERWYARGFDSDVEQDHGFYWHYVEFVARHPERHAAARDFGLKHALGVYAADSSATRLEPAQLRRLAEAAQRLGLSREAQALRTRADSVVPSRG